MNAETTGGHEPRFQNGTDLAALLAAIPGGAFTSVISPAARSSLARDWGSPLFAIEHLAGDLIRQRRPVQVACGGACIHLADVGGRWLSLLAKAVDLPKGSSFTIWTERRPKRYAPPKDLMFQPPQKIVTKAWTRVLETSTPDLLLLYAPFDTSDLGQMMADLASIPRQVRTLLAFGSPLHALLARQQLVLYGYNVRDCAYFPIDGSERDALGVGAVWCEVVLEADDALNPADEEGICDWVFAARQFDVALSADPSVEMPDLGEVHATYRDITAGDRTGRALMVTPHVGMFIEDGYWFHLQNEDDSLDPYTPSKELLEALPREGTFTEPFNGLSPRERNRYACMVWLGHVMHEHQHASAPSEEVRTSVEAASTDTAPPRADAAVDAPVIAPEVARTVASERAPRPWRLPRKAGTIEVLALAAMLGPLGVGQQRVTLRDAVVQVLKWLSNKGYRELSPDVSGHDSQPGGEVAVETDGTTVWAMRFDDRSMMERGAIWRVELTLLEVLIGCAISVRLYQLRTSDSAPEPVSGVPSVVAEMGRQFGLHDAGTPLLSTAHRISNADNLPWLSKLITAPERGLAVVVVSSTSKGGPDKSIDRLATRLTGVAHVVAIDKSTAFGLSRRLGDRLSVYGNAIRVYRQGFNTDDPSGDHPFWVFKGQTIPTGLADLVSEAASAFSVDFDDLDDRAPAFRRVRHELSESRLQVMREQSASLASTAEEERARHVALIAELEQSLTESKAEVAELKSRLALTQDDLKGTRRERDDALDELRQRKHLGRRWHATPDAGDGLDEGTSGTLHPVDYPDSWDELESWVDDVGNGNLVLLPGAAKAARDSLFEDVPFAYQALHLLANEYVAMKTRDHDDDQPRQDFEQALNALGLELSGIGTAKDDRRFKQDYRRRHEGDWVTLDLHLKRGAGFDPTTLFRVYFTYCEDTCRVLVGHLPGHLTNRMTRNA